MWPAGQQQPVVSTLNNPTGTIVANTAIVPAGTDGAVAATPTTIRICYRYQPLLRPSGQNGLSLLAEPCRVIDTRDNDGQPFSRELTGLWKARCSTPSDAQAYIFNATVVPSGRLVTDAMAQPRRPANGLNAEAHRRSNHLQLAMSRRTWRDRRLCIGAYTPDPGHLRLFRTMTLFMFGKSGVGNGGLCPAKSLPRPCERYTSIQTNFNGLFIASI